MEGIAVLRGLGWALCAAALAACANVPKESTSAPEITPGTGGLVEFQSGARCFGVADDPNQGLISGGCAATQSDTVAAFLTLGYRFPAEEQVLLISTVMGSLEIQQSGLLQCVLPGIAGTACRWVVKKVFESTPLNAGEDEEVRRRDAEWDACKDTDRCADPTMDDSRKRYQDRERERMQGAGGQMSGNGGQMMGSGGQMTGSGGSGSGGSGSGGSGFGGSGSGGSGGSGSGGSGGSGDGGSGGSGSGGSGGSGDGGSGGSGAGGSGGWGGSGASGGWGGSGGWGDPGGSWEGGGGFEPPPEEPF
jgi:hypothetical protein